jgi:hypothetical protein
MNSTNSTTSNTNNTTKQIPNNTASTNANPAGAVFNKTSYIFILWFLAIYVVAYYFIGFFFKKPSDESSFLLKISRGVDFIVLVGLLIFLFTSYFTNTEPQREAIYQTITTL